MNTPAKRRYIIALDQGTTSSRCVIFDNSGKIVQVVQKEFKQIFPKPGWVEHDPMEIYASQYSVMIEAIAQSGIHAKHILGIGITNQRETTIVWDKVSGKPIYNAIVWQCRRTADLVETIKKDKKMSEYIKENTGLLPDAYFSATKLQWILDNVEGAREKAERGELLFGTVDTWLMWKLTGGKVHATDYSNASRTMMFNINTLDWDDEILEILGIPRCMLPEVKPSSGLFGCTEEEAIGRGIPITGAAGDQQAALFGQTCYAPGEAKNTYGTGCFLLMNTGDKPVFSEHGLVTTVAWGLNGEVRYALEGSIFVGGAAVQWLREELKLVERSSDTEAAALRASDTNGCYVVPAFTGLGAPHWDQYARGTIVGLTRGCGRDHIIRATLDSIAYQVCDVIRAMEADTGMKLSSLKVDGGAAANGYLLQTQSDLLDAEVLRPECLESTAMGAAYLAGLATGYWKDVDEIRAIWKISRSFTPQIEAQKREEMLRGWERAVRCAYGWAKE